jgi:hypothetical protein
MTGRNNCMKNYSSGLEKREIFFINQSQGHEEGEGEASGGESADPAPASTVAERDSTSRGG